MSRSLSRIALSCLALGLLAVAPAAAQGQSARPAWTKQFLQHAVKLAGLEDVQKEVKITDQQKTKIADLDAKLDEDRQGVFQSFGGDGAKFSEDMAKVNADIGADLAKTLDEAQQKRLHEIYLQVNGINSLQDNAVADSLGLSEEQRKKLAEAVTAARERGIAFFQEAQGMSPEEADKKREELIKERDESYAAVLADEQKKKLDELKGAAFDADLSKLPSPFGG